MSRVPFAVWNTVAARPMAPVAIPNASAAMSGDEQKRSGWAQRGRGCPKELEANAQALWLCPRRRINAFRIMIRLPRHSVVFSAYEYGTIAVKDSMYI